MKRYVTECAGCGGTIAAGDKIWVSDIGEESVITHPLPECLKKYIQPEESRFVSEEGKDYAVEVQSGEVIVRPLGETEEPEGDDLVKAIAYFVREIDLLKERVTELELEVGANS